MENLSGLSLPIAISVPDLKGAVCLYILSIPEPFVDILSLYNNKE